MVDVSHLHFNVIQRVWEAIPDKTDKIARDCLTHMLDYIVIDIRKKLSSLGDRETNTKSQRWRKAKAWLRN